TRFAPPRGRRPARPAAPALPLHRGARASNGAGRGRRHGGPKDVDDLIRTPAGAARPERAPRTILVTGCSSGIGYHAAHTLKKRGWRVFAACRREADCARLAAEGLETARLDYADAESIA